MEKFNITNFEAIDYNEITNDLLIAKSMEIISSNMIDILIIGLVCGFMFGGLTYFLIDKFYIRKNIIMIHRTKEEIKNKK